MLIFLTKIGGVPHLSSQIYTKLICKGDVLIVVNLNKQISNT